MRMLVQPLSLLMSCSERSIWSEAQPTVAAQHSACHYPVSTANTTLHLSLSHSQLFHMHILTFFNPPTTHTHKHVQTYTQPCSLKVQNESSMSQEPEAKVQLKPFVMCHTTLPKLGQLYAL